MASIIRKNNTILKKKTILFIGPYSAVGGVSVHIKRLSTLMLEKYQVSFVDESPLQYSKGEVFNIRSKNILQYLKLLKNADVVHIHSGVSLLRCFHILAGFLLRKKVIVTYHTIYNLPSKIAIFINRVFLPLTHKVICVTEEIYNILKPKNNIIFPAFVPPNIKTEQPLPESLLSILERNTEKKIIVSNAFRLDLHEGGDLYGLDLLIDVARRIIKEKLAYKIIFVVADPNGENGLYPKYSELIKQEALEYVISLIPQPISFINLVLKSDVVIRATSSDGDALTVREAMYLHRPVIASDVTKRPEGSVLFKNRDSEDLFQKIKHTLQLEENTEKTKENSANRAKDFYLSFYVGIYN